MHDPNEAFHRHLHDVIEHARAEADTREPIKVPVRIKPATFLVAYYNEDGPEVDGTIECDSLDEARQVQEGLNSDDTRTRIFVDADLIRLRDYERDFAYVGEEIRKEQAQAQSDHEG